MIDFTTNPNSKKNKNIIAVLVSILTVIYKYNYGDRINVSNLYPSEIAIWIITPNISYGAGIFLFFWFLLLRGNKYGYKNNFIIYLILFLGQALGTYCKIYF